MTLFMSGSTLCVGVDCTDFQIALQTKNTKTLIMANAGDDKEVIMTHKHTHIVQWV